MSKRPFVTPYGATPIADASELIPSEIFTYRDLCIAEAQNILSAVNKHLHGRRKNLLTWFSPDALKRMHREMFSDVWGWAGRYRRTQTNIGVRPSQIAVEMHKLCEDVRWWLSNPQSSSPLDEAVRLHHRLVAIHPFENGNGRHSRLTADIYLKHRVGWHPQWPEDLGVGGTHRKNYLCALRAADRGNYDPLLELYAQLQPA